MWNLFLVLRVSYIFYPFSNSPKGRDITYWRRNKWPASNVKKKRIMARMMNTIRFNMKKMSSKEKLLWRTSGSTWIAHWHWWACLPFFTEHSDLRSRSQLSPLLLEISLFYVCMILRVFFVFFKFKEQIKY